MNIEKLQQKISKKAFFLPCKQQIFPSYKKQTIDLQNGSIDLFLFEGNIGRLSHFSLL